ncbi:hypothetical protein [carnivorous sponge associated iridovirus]|nr:hypothetical protein [carnivorous sponge associated iridovirus]
MIEKNKAIMSNQIVNVISAEQDPAFHKLNVENIVLDLPKYAPAPGQKGIWLNIKYKYSKNGKEKQDKLKIQTSELFSYGISRYGKKANLGAANPEMAREDTSPPKMCFVMVNRKLREAIAKGEDISEEDAEDIKVEDETIKMLEDITEKVKELMKESDMINALGKQRDKKKWLINVDGMEIIKRKEQENGIDSVYVYSKVVTANNFMKTKFHILDDNEEEGVRDLDQDETVETLEKKEFNCKATAMLVIDSVFVGTEPYLQVKLAEAVISEFSEYKVKRNIIMPARLRNKSADKKKSNSKLYDSDSDSDDDKKDTKKTTKKVIKDDSDDSE